MSGAVCVTAENSGLLKNLEHVSTANALQLEAGRRGAVPIRLNTSLVASLNSLSLSVAVLERIYCLYVTLCNRAIRGGVIAV